ncbi:MAG TPA: DoxX family protein [Anaerolineales bacterium]|nr:DoxX family protein [Anaerolineales bacterium]
MRIPPLWFDRLDSEITSFMIRRSIPILRVSLGATFLWFGLLKFFPGLSPAQNLASSTIERLTFGLVPPEVSIPILAAWEAIIGLGLISGLFLRGTLFLLFVQMLGTMTPLLLFPEQTFTRFPYAPTLEGQYIIKNLVLISAGLVVGATVRGARLREDGARRRSPIEAHPI